MVAPAALPPGGRRPQQPDLRGHATRAGAPLRAAPAADRPSPADGPRHGPGAPDHLRPGPGRRARARRRSACAPTTSVNGAPFYVMGFVDGVIARDRGGGRGGPRRGRPGTAPAWPWSTPWPRSTPSTPTPSASATSAARRATSPASCGAGTATTRPLDESRGGTRLADVDERPRPAGRPTSPSRARPAVVHGDYRLDNCVIVRRRRRCWPCSTGSCAPSATPWPTSGQLLVYWPEPGRALGPRALPDRSPPAFRPEPS